MTPADMRLMIERFEAALLDKATEIADLKRELRAIIQDHKFASSLINPNWGKVAAHMKERAEQALYGDDDEN